MIGVITQLTAKIKALGYDIMFEFVPNSVDYPYISYDFDIVTTFFKTQTADFSLKVWSSDLAECVAISDAIWKTLDGYSSGIANGALYVRQGLNQKINTSRDNEFGRLLVFTVIFEEV
jgi:hypothetical protein